MIYDPIGQHEHEQAGSTATKVREVGVESESILVIPAGGIEQHGEHLLVVTGLLSVEAMVDSAIEQANSLPIVVSPATWGGFSPRHLALGEVLSLSFETIRTTFEDITYTGLQNDFDTVLFVNGHSGSGPLIGSVVSAIGVEIDVGASRTTYFELATDRIGALRDTETGGMAHGGESETSLMLAIRPGPVGNSPARDGEPLSKSYRRSGQGLLDRGSMSVHRSFDTYSETGAIGLLEEASVKGGERTRPIIVGELASLLDAVHEQDT